MNNKAQISVEFIIIIGFILILTLFFANSVFGTSDINKSVTKVKLRTLELFSTMDSRAELTKIDYVIVDKNLDLSLYINRHTEDFNLSDANYSATVNNLEKSTAFQYINIYPVYYN